jgi:TorA-specific chaperone
MTDVSLHQLSQDRAALYHWFAQLYTAPPTAAEVSDLQHGAAQALLQALARVPGAEAGVGMLQALLAVAPPAQLAADIGAAHARLFYGAAGPGAVLPYRSVHDGDEGLTGRQAMADMDRLLRQHRLRLATGTHELPDHLGVQLEALSHLARRVAECTQAGTPTSLLLAEQADFVATQLLSWLPAFALRVTLADTLGFHAGLGRVLLAVVEQDHAYLTEGCAA